MYIYICVLVISMNDDPYLFFRYYTLLIFNSVLRSYLRNQTGVPINFPYTVVILVNVFN